MKIILVDDEPTTLELYAALLEDDGHQVIKRDRALGTTPLILSERPHVVLVDIDMPGLPGDELARLLHDNPRAKGVNVVLLSARQREELKRIAARCGAGGYLQKSADVELFMARFRDVTGRLEFSDASQPA